MDCTKALNWCNINRSKLGKALSPLEFKLRMQEFISLLHQKDDSIAAIHYARKNLVKFIQSAQEEQGHTEETQALLRKQINKVFQAMGLVAYQKT